MEWEPSKHFGKPYTTKPYPRNAFLLEGYHENDLIYFRLTHSILQAIHTLDKCQTHFNVMAFNCDELKHVMLVEAFCVEHQIHISTIDNKKLGEQVGLCKIEKRNWKCGEHS